ncbi:MAG: type IV pili methyl-accepting chemotaxis transducer N-terminal domain-containing protein [Proteobacteria bacterium]|nr:type IV pili methyl-accepting chemotaxis transducer N-terminal domain-containing protein [Pseudomonadota bacterium]
MDSDRNAAPNARQSVGLATKLIAVVSPFLVLAMLMIGATLWMSWRLDGGAAALNEAGRLRMQAYRMSMEVGTAGMAADRADAEATLARHAAQFDASLRLLTQGDPERDLAMPSDPTVQSRLAAIERAWARWRARWIVPAAAASASAPAELGADTAAFVQDIDALVGSIQAHMQHWTALLHLLQLAMMGVLGAGTIALIYSSYVFVLEPVALLQRATKGIQGGDFAVRVDRVSQDEFGTLARGFNEMAEHLQTAYRTLESRVAAKTAELQDKTGRLESLYQVSLLVSRANSLEALANGFVQSIRRIAHADGVALRWAHAGSDRYLMLASEGLPSFLLDAEQCIHAGDCYCGSADQLPAPRIAPIIPIATDRTLHCVRAGFETVLNLPVRVHARVVGEVDLFFHARVTLSAEERSLLETLNSHFAAAMENLRLDAQEKEAAVSQERSLLARELHDSIAQSLAFLKIQVQLLREAFDARDQKQMEQVLGEIDAGVRESYADVRELLVHFRTRANDEDIEIALTSTLQKFERQSGLRATLRTSGYGVPLPADVQIQILHIVQEALSNVRKHAQPSQVWVDVQQQPVWRFEVRDDGVGFDVAGRSPDDTHVGLRIMAERAERIGARLEVSSRPGAGTSTVLTLPPLPSAAARTREDGATAAAQQ